MEMEDLKNKRSNDFPSAPSQEDTDVIQISQWGSDSSSALTASPDHEVYKLYKRRWFGLAGICLLNIVSGLNWMWFSAIAVNASQEFGISVEKINWLGTSVSLVYLPICLIVPLGFSSWGFRNSYVIGSLSLIIASWIRYIGTIPDLESDGKYALLLVGQIFTGLAQPWFQILGPKYSETWFDSRGRTTATMLIAIANPIGAALSQLLAPAFSTVRESILNLAIITSAVAPIAMLITSKPPIPPSYSGSQPSPPGGQILRALVGRTRPGESFMSFRERIDMMIVTLLFGSFVGAFTAFSILISQIFTPYGYSSDEAGIMGGVLILAGIVGAATISPIIDRYLATRLALAIKILIPLLSASYIALIWDVRADNYAGIYVVMIAIGVASFTLLPIALEIGCEVTRSAETSSTILWFTGNLLSVVLVLSMNALVDDSAGANPPSNMFKSLIFQACFVSVASISVFGLEAQQKRRELDRREQPVSYEGQARSV